MKKGLTTYTFLISIILFTIVMVGFLNFYSGFKDQQERSYDKQDCKASVFANHLECINSDEQQSDFPILCPTRDVTIEEDVNEKNDRKIKRKIAEELYECADNFYQGKLLMFGEENNIYCVVCSVMSFEDKTGTILGMGKYLMTEKTVKRKKLTYMDFLAGYETGRSTNMLESFNPSQKETVEGIPMLTGFDYATIFIYAKGEGIIEEFIESQPAATAAGGMVLGGGALAILVLGGPVTWVIGGIGAVALGAGVIYDNIIKIDDPPDYIGLTLLTRYTSTRLQQLGCTKTPAVQAAEYVE